ncbi:hypothetical protein RchiOBHm_Chr4g0445861 [Rosa chinensis]|uniref:Uncharacterized protein n=1 Tax=Rosa chinensis TaxID=74649 RepID=A0A2P6R4I1_ROSCH|nr:hypothetical protein RchiOBHm_Chr4g0445861 [Rosa chinensis]
MVEQASRLATFMSRKLSVLPESMRTVTDCFFTYISFNSHGLWICIPGQGMNSNGKLIIVIRITITNFSF